MAMPMHSNIDVTDALSDINVQHIRRIKCIAVQVSTVPGIAAANPLPRFANNSSLTNGIVCTVCAICVRGRLSSCRLQGPETSNR